MTKQAAVIGTADANKGVIAEAALKVVKGKTNGAANSEEPLSGPEVLAYDDVITRYTRTVMFKWYELGEAAKVIKARELWKQYEAAKNEEPFHSFEDYINRRAQRSRTAIYRALQLRVGLDTLPESDCREMSQANAIWLLRLVKRLNADHPEKVLTAEVVGAALSMNEKDFAEFCNERLPGAAREEKQESISFHVDKSLAKVVDQALQVAMWDAEVDHKNDALERIVTYYLEGRCEQEGLHKLSNREAYMKSKGKKRTH